MFAVQSYATVKLICLMGHLIRCESRLFLYFAGASDKPKRLL